MVIEKGCLRRQPMCAAERHPAPDAERLGLRAGVEHRASRPGLAAQDDRTAREPRGPAVRPGETEGQMGPEEVEESHGL